ncbi:MAG: class I SAM-dependent methyltransferase [Thermoplasmata archaeon]|nr:class I SAM-dependent methyltransferase [Thermoplasmata archaeon]
MNSLHLAAQAVRHPSWAWNALRMVPRMSRFTGVPEEQLTTWLRELGASRLGARLEERWRNDTGSALSGYSGGSTLGPSNEGLYLLVRASHPDKVVETGVASGFSTSYILQALKDVGRGSLCSLDLPVTRLTGSVNADGVREKVHVRSVTETGQVIPDDLRDRWRLVVGSSTERLATLLEGLGKIDFFFHDSDHSYQNMMFEYRTAWTRLAIGGVLASDDIDWNSSFFDFAKEAQRAPVKWVGRGAIRV